MIFIVYHLRKGYEYDEPIFFGAFYSEAGAIKCKEMLTMNPDTNEDNYHIASLEERTLS